MQYSWEEVIIWTDQEGFLEMTFALNDLKNQGQRMVSKANSKYTTMWQEEFGLFKKNEVECK